MPTMSGLGPLGPGHPGHPGHPGPPGPPMPPTPPGQPAPAGAGPGGPGPPFGVNMPDAWNLKVEAKKKCGVVHGLKTNMYIYIYTFDLPPAQ